MARNPNRPVRVLLVLPLALLAAACAGSGTSEPAAPSAGPIAYLCDDGRQIEAQPVGEELRLDLGGGDVRLLERTPAASGARHVGGSGAQAIEFWSKEGSALLIEGGRSQNCVTAAAPSPPVERVEDGTPHPLTGTRWRVVQLDAGAPLPPDLPDEQVPRLEFLDSATLAGSSGCNGFRAAWAATADGIQIGQAASTRRACAPPVMQREQRFFELLSGTVGHRLRPDGTLVLETADGRRLLARPLVQG